MIENTNKSEFNESSETTEKAQLLLLLNEEISEIQKEESRPGWTMWAIFGGIATCVWLLLGQIEKQIPAWEVIKIMLIIITLLFYSIKGFLVIINDEKEISTNYRLISTRQAFYKSKISLIIILLWFLLIGYFVINNNIVIPIWAASLTYISIGLNIIFLFFILLMSFLNLIIPDNKEGLPNNIFIFLFIISFFGASFFSSIFWINILIENNLIFINEFKISLLIIAIVILLVLSTSLKSSSHSFTNLLELRRDLILDTLPIVQIKNQTELILRGLSVKDYYVDDINEILSSLSLFGKELFQAIQKIELYQKNETIQIEEKEKILTQDSLRESILKHFIAAAKIKFSQVDTAKKRLTKKRAILKGINKVFKKDFTDTEIVKEVFDSTLESIYNYNDTVKLWHQIIAKTVDSENAQKMIIELCVNVPELKYNIKTGEVEE